MKRLQQTRNPEPLYLQIAVALRRDIAQGALQPNEKLPPISNLAKEYGVAVVTIRQALAILEQEGLLKRYQGRGTFVAREPMVNRSITLRSDISSLLEHLEGKRPTLLMVADKIATPMIDPRYGQIKGPYRFMRRVHSWDSTPYALINIYLDQGIYELDPELFDNGMVISALEQLPNVTIGRLRQSVSFTTADPETSQALSLPVNAAIGDVLRVITDESDRVIYVGQTKYRGDFVKLEFDSKEQR